MATPIIAIDISGYGTRASADVGTVSFLVFVKEKTEISFVLVTALIFLFKYIFPSLLTELFDPSASFPPAPGYLYWQWYFQHPL